VIPSGSLVMGAPARVKRSLTESDRTSIADYAKRYVGYKNIYREEAASE
jgi:carbonic anhydrase/acetyltransferase-like protein (isoleucine patch superfamily)